MSNKNQAMSAVSMEQFGMNTVVLTPHKSLEKIRNRFTKSPDLSWGEGKGKLHLYNQLKAKLLAEDVFFESHKAQAINSNHRWVDFCDDCIIFAVLSNVLFDTPVLLVHPSSYSHVTDNASIKPSKNILPSLIAGIQYMQ